MGKLKINWTEMQKKAQDRNRKKKKNKKKILLNSVVIKQPSI